MNSKHNGMPNWSLSQEKCPATKGFTGLTIMPGKISATTSKSTDKRDGSRVVFVDITARKRNSSK